MTIERKVVEGGVYVLNNGTYPAVAYAKGRGFHLYRQGDSGAGLGLGGLCNVDADGVAECLFGNRELTDRYSVDWPATEALQKPREIRVGDRVRLKAWDGAIAGGLRLLSGMRRAVGTVKTVVLVDERDGVMQVDYWFWPLSACELVTDEPAMERGFHGEKLEQAIRKSFAFAPNLNAPMLSRDVEGRPPLAWNTRTPFDHFPDMQFVVTRGGAS